MAEDRPNKNPRRKGTTHMKRAQAKAHFNFHKRLRDAEEAKRMKEQLDSESFDFDVNESPLAERANPDREPPKARQQRHAQRQGSTTNGDEGDEA